jgi:hypothetical protein
MWVRRRVRADVDGSGITISSPGRRPHAHLEGPDMIETLHRWAPVLRVWALALPLAAVLAGLLAVRRGAAGCPSRQAWTTAAAEVAMVAGTLPWIWMILTPTSAPGGVELVPGVGLARIVAQGPSTVLVQVGANLLVLGIVGALAPVRWPVGPGAVAAGAAAVSALLEGLQYVLDLGRVSSVDDVLLNTAGALLGALLTRRWWLRRVPLTLPSAPDRRGGEGMGVTGRGRYP